MTFSTFSQYLQKLESTTLRLKKTEILAELIKKSNPQEIDKLCYLALGRLVPLHQSLEFHFAEKLIIKGLAQRLNLSSQKLTLQYKKIGDLGEYIEKLNLPTPLDFSSKMQNLASLTNVHQQLTKIAQTKGTGSQAAKFNLLYDLLLNLDSLSRRYIIRIVLNKLRLGFSDKTLLDALSWTTAGNKSLSPYFNSAYNHRADIGHLAKLVLQYKTQKQLVSHLQTLRPQPGTPIIPALCQRLATAEEMLKKMTTQNQSKIAIEIKYDGSRIQAHISSKGIQLFSRTLENMTAMFPDIVKALHSLKGIKNAILDGEIIGIDPQTKKMIDFQKFITRKRKYNIKTQIQKIPARFMIFDLLYLNNHSFIEKPFLERRLQLKKLLLSPKTNENLALTPQIQTNSPQLMRDFLNQQLKASFEGAVVKQLQAPYSPGRTGFTWVKFKWEGQAKQGGMLDTVDGLIMGYYRGQGKRAAFGIGAFLIGIRQKNKFLTLAKIGTGLSDNQWRDLKKQSDQHKTNKLPSSYQIPKTLMPDILIQPQLVAEIQADNLTKSPLHSAGYALRFPRLVRLRPDKKPINATSLKELKQISQKNT
jgi:DNA ligase-1